MKTAQNTTQNTISTDISFSEVINGNPLEIGSGFNALSFREKEYHGAMDPLIMVDHYTMTESTFGPHPHAGLSAVSVIFEDSVGKFRNRDSLGNDFDLLPGDLYWLKAGSGIVHDEAPRKNSKTHGLQVFVNLPVSQKHSVPESLHVKATEIPVIEENGARIRIVLGESNGVKGQNSPALPMTIIEGKMQPDGSYDSSLNTEKSAWLYAIDGQLTIEVSGRKTSLSSGQSIAIQNTSAQHNHVIKLINESSLSSKFAMFVGTPIKEAFVQYGPFVMSTEAEIKQIEADYRAGKLGQLLPV